MGSLYYIKGDATYPIGDGFKYILHICNDVGGWGSGFVVAISNRWKSPENMYRMWFNQYKNVFKLGAVQYVWPTEDICVVNMIAQNGKKNINNPVPVRYNELEQCLIKVSNKLNPETDTIHMPRIGTNRGGGDWNIIEKMIKNTLCHKGFTVNVYDPE